MAIQRCPNCGARHEDHPDVNDETYRVAEALRREAIAIFGSTWNYEHSWQLARAAINELKNPP